MRAGGIYGLALELTIAQRGTYSAICWGLVPMKFRMGSAKKFGLSMD